MTIRLGMISWATGTLMLVAVAACASSSSDADPSSSPPVSSSVPTAASSSPSPRSDSGVASATAEDVVSRYFTVLDGLRQDPSKPVKHLSSVATSTQLTAQTRLLTTERSQGLRQVGTTRVAEMTVQSVSLDNSDPSAGKVPTVTVDVCWDVSNADLIDQSGKSVVSRSRASTGWTRYTVANYDWSENPSSGWRIATSQDLKQTPCAAS
ncbi:hypothetical protein [Nocardioides sp. Soil805]|uniref:hypothetical protein n=1 Tax=Nocardioides sp. Soil805 TaxID=1736416 RepID=UPI0009E9AEE7|nr:hypothetical protein [Nocardioides sp. Soil805]